MLAEHLHAQIPVLGTDTHGSTLGSLGVSPAELLDRLLSQERELGGYRALTREAESLRTRLDQADAERERLTAELHEQRLLREQAERHAAELETKVRPRRWWTRA